MAAAGEDNPLGLGPRDRGSSNTGSVEDTSYEAHGSDRYETGEIEKDFGGLAGADRARDDLERSGRDPAGRSRSVADDENVPGSDEP